ALRADIIHLEHPVARNLPLDREVPLLVLRVVVLGGGRAGAETQEPQRIAAWRIRQAHRPRILERGVLCSAAIQAPLNAGIGEGAARSSQFKRLYRSVRGISKS